MKARRFLGVFINPLYVQNEGLEPVLDNISSVGAHAICLSPFIARPADVGTRFPDLHVDGYERLVARPVWGQREIRLERFRAYASDLSLYKGGPYRPLVRPAPSDLDTGIPSKMAAEAKKRGMQTHIICHPFLPPDVRVQDQPVYIDGSSPKLPRVALNACLNAPAAETYGLALIQDIVQHYGDIDGLIPDWIEFGAYQLQDHFSCFCPHCALKAKEQGLDWERIQHDVRVLWDWLHSLTSRELERSRRLRKNPSELIELLTHYPGWLYLLRFKAGSVVGFYRKMRALLDHSGLAEIEIVARGWPPPWNRSSGMDYRALADVCDVIAPKLFTFDYSALPRWFGQTLLGWNPELGESEILDALVEWMNLPDDFERRSFANYHIPAPDERHPARIETYRVRLDEVVAQVGGRARVYPIAHPYLPEPQWKRMVATIRDSRVDGMWVHMYGYLSDRKLEILKEMWV